MKNERVTLGDIAEAAHVSIATVSRVLTGQARQYRIKTATVNRVLKLAEELGYRHRRSHRFGISSQSKTIGLVIPDLSHFFLSDLAKRIRIQASELGYSILVCDAMEKTETEIECIDLLLQREVCGLIILPVGKENAHLQTLHQRSIPMVVVDRVMPDLNCSTVSVDNYEGARSAVEYLIHMGTLPVGQ
jgi:LacI family transcriptional regulator